MFTYIIHVICTCNCQNVRMNWAHVYSYKYLAENIQYIQYYEYGKNLLLILGIRGKNSRANKYQYLELFTDSIYVIHCLYKITIYSKSNYWGHTTCTRAIQIFHIILCNTIMVLISKSAFMAIKLWCEMTLK